MVSKVKMDLLEKREKEAQQRIQLKEEVGAELGSSKIESEPAAQAQQMPLFPELASAMPTKWTRTAMFANIRPGKRKMYNQTLLASRSDVQIRMTGEQLDMVDNDFFLQAVRLAQNTEAGTIIHVNRRTFLLATGRTDSVRSYALLERSMKRLRSTTLFFENDTTGDSLNLIKELKWDKKSGSYWFQLDPKIGAIFRSLDIAFIDLDLRLKLKTDLAKFLQNYAAGHKAETPHSVRAASLMSLSGAMGRVNDFINRALPPALKELENAGLIRDSAISKSGIVKWTRCAHKKSKLKRSLELPA